MKRILSILMIMLVITMNVNIVNAATTGSFGMPWTKTLPFDVQTYVFAHYYGTGYEVFTTDILPDVAWVANNEYGEHKVNINLTDCKFVRYDINGVETFYNSSGTLDVVKGIYAEPRTPDGEGVIYSNFQFEVQGQVYWQQTDYGNFQVTTAIEFASLRFDATGHGPDITSAELHIYELALNWQEATTLELLNGEYDTINSWHYVGPFNLANDPTSFRFGLSDGWSQQRAYRAEVPYYDDGVLIGTIFVSPQDTVLEFDHQDETAVSDLINSGWRISYGQNDMTISNVMQGYTDIKIEMVDITDNSLPKNDYVLETLEKGVEYAIPYPYNLTWQHEYMITISKKTSIITYSQLYQSQFIYGYTVDNTGSSNTMDTSSLQEYGTFDDLIQDVKATTGRAEKGLQAFSEIFSMLPPPLNEFATYIIGGLVIIFVIGIGLLIFNR